MLHQIVVLFSGGRTSGLMLRRLLDLNSDFLASAIVCFANTGKERAETLDFVHEVETRWNVPIVWLEYHRVFASTIPPGIFPTPKRNQNLEKAAQLNETVHWFKQVSFETASRNGEPFDELLEWMSVLPNVVSRACSMQLKIRTVMRYLFSLGIKEYSPVIGIRKDEESRATEILGNCDYFEHPQFPLIEMGVTEQDVAHYWKGSDFDLHLQSYEGNCDLCFLKAKWKRIRLIQEHPEFAKWWKGWESKKAQSSSGNGCVFRLGEEYSRIETLAISQSRQSELCFVGSKDIPCSCAEKGFSQDEDD